MSGIDHDFNAGTTNIVETLEGEQSRAITSPLGYFGADLEKTIGFPFYYIPKKITGATGSANP
jgi:hypothetical protein